MDRKEYNRLYYLNNKEKIDAKNKAWRLLNPTVSNAHSAKWKSSNPCYILWKTAKTRAKTKGLEFSIEIDDIVIPEVCPILGTQFEIGSMYAATVDRIKPEKGYVKGNIQIISKKANMMKSNANEKELLHFAEWVYANYAVMGQSSHPNIGST